MQDITKSFNIITFCTNKRDFIQRLIYGIFLCEYFTVWNQSCIFAYWLYYAKTFNFMSLCNDAYFPLFWSYKFIFHHSSLFACRNRFVPTCWISSFIYSYQFWEAIGSTLAKRLSKFLNAAYFLSIWFKVAFYRCDITIKSPFFPKNYFKENNKIMY